MAPVEIQSVCNKIVVIEEDTIPYIKHTGIIIYDYDDMKFKQTEGISDVE